MWQTRASFSLKGAILPKDVAVLVSTTKMWRNTVQKLLQAMRNKGIECLTNESDVGGDHMVLDSVRRFSGLERSIVFGIHPSTEPAISYNILVCLASRANQLHILGSVTFKKNSKLKQDEAICSVSVHGWQSDWYWKKPALSHSWVS